MSPLFPYFLFRFLLIYSLSNGNSNIHIKHIFAYSNWIKKIYNQNLKKRTPVVCYSFNEDSKTFFFQHENSLPNSSLLYKKGHYSGEPRNEKYSGEMLYKMLFWHMNVLWMLTSYCISIFQWYAWIISYIYSLCIFHIYLYIWVLLRFELIYLFV